LLADELSLGLAPLVVRRLLESLREAAAQGTAVLIVEQHPKTALRWTNRGYVMRRGKVELASQSADLLARQDEITALYL
jgi:branched-chain amino acid transport system ATP-binding protein